MGWFAGLGITQDGRSDTVEGESEGGGEAEDVLSGHADRPRGRYQQHNHSIEHI